MDENPYASPTEPFDDTRPDMIDSVARDELCSVVDDYLFDRLGTFAFDEVLWKIHGKTDDRTVQIVAEQLWYTYDDLKDHMVVLNKHNWNAIQRFLLVIQSNAELQWDKRKVWHMSQAVALATLAAAIWACLLLWEAWALYFFLAGLISIALTVWRQRKRRAWEPIDPWNMWPFPSFAALRGALGRAPGFQKKKYRSELATRQIRPWASVLDVKLPWWFGHCIASPIVLAAQCFPLRIERVLLSWQPER